MNTLAKANTGNDEASNKTLNADDFLLRSDLVNDEKFQWLAPMVRPILEGNPQ